MRSWRGKVPDGGLAPAGMRKAARAAIRAAPHRFRHRDGNDLHWSLPFQGTIRLIRNGLNRQFYQEQGGEDLCLRGIALECGRSSDGLPPFLLGGLSLLVGVATRPDTTASKLAGMLKRQQAAALQSSAYQFVMEPSGRWNMGMGRERSVISAASCRGLVSKVTPSPGRRFGHILPLWKS